MSRTLSLLVALGVVALAGTPAAAMPGPSPAVSATIAILPSGQLAGVSSSGVSMRYDGAGRMVGRTGQGRLADVARDIPGAARLVSATLGETFDGSTSQGEYAFAYGYDGLQNLVRREAVSVPTGALAPRMASGVYEHGGSGYGPRQLAAVPSAGVTLGYDGAGRMVSRSGTAFAASMAYDASDRVRVVALGDDEVRHRYGPSGERNWTGWFEDDVLEREEYRFASGLALRNDRYELVVGLGGSRSLARISVPEVADTTHEVTYMHPGVGPGAVTFTDKAGALIEERLHEPFGVALEGPGADYEQEPLGWNAKPIDPWTEWSDHGARWHGTDLAHWLSPDPLLRGPDPKLLGEFWRASPYGFVAGNPVTFWDPDGLSPAAGAVAALPRVVPAIQKAVREFVRTIGSLFGGGGRAWAGGVNANTDYQWGTNEEQLRLQATCDWCWQVGSKSEDATQQETDTGPDTPVVVSPEQGPTKAAPGSKHIQVHPTQKDKAIQTTIYGEDGLAIGHVDWKEHHGQKSGHGHRFTEPGKPSTGHQGRGTLYRPGELPDGWGDLPDGITPIGG